MFVQETKVLIMASKYREQQNYANALMTVRLHHQSHTAH